MCTKCMISSTQNTYHACDNSSIFSTCYVYRTLSPYNCIENVMPATQSLTLNAYSTHNKSANIIRSVCMHHIMKRKFE